MATFGRIVAEARKKAGYSQKEFAAKLKKESGERISPQYLNDIEHDRRNPPGEFLIDQFAKYLSLPKDYLMLAAGTLPAEETSRIVKAKPDEVAAAFKAFRAKLKRLAARATSERSSRARRSR
jgi:transcriptional regulator with XRE-family HTH domain